VRAHSWRIEDPPVTPEGWLCRYADRIAYLTHDVEDALRAGVLEYHDIPTRALTTFGATAREWIGAMVRSVIEASHESGTVIIDPADLDVMNELRAFMFDRVYLRPESEAQKNRAIAIIQDLVGYFAESPAEVPPSATEPGAEPLQRAIDYVAGMTDRYALHTHDRLFRPRLFD
jgi:dGTPase